VIGRAPGLAAWLASVAPARARGIVTVAVVSDARVRALNRKFRKKDRATDVLSFPATGLPRRPVRRSAQREGGSAETAEAGYLGDVVIASGVAARQAREAGHSLATELRVLALHGLLHLLGYDHEHDDGRMARLERRLRRRGGLREGLIERA
jgi:probable rRNA maturation factor